MIRTPVDQARISNFKIFARKRPTYKFLTGYGIVYR